MKMRFPPSFKLLIRGYLVMAVIFILAGLRLIPSIGLVILAMTVVSISMVFGIGLLLMNTSRPVRRGYCDIPSTVLVFVKGILVIYFVSLLGTYGILPLEITGLLMTGVAFVMTIFGVVSYVFEVFERATPIKARRERARIIKARMKARRAAMQRSR